MSKTNWAKKLKQSGIYRRLRSYSELLKAKRAKPITFTAPPGVPGAVYKSATHVYTKPRVWNYAALLKAKRISSITWTKGIALGYRP